MAKYLKQKDIEANLQEGFNEEGSIEKAFDYLLENSL